MGVITALVIFVAGIAITGVSGILTNDLQDWLLWFIKRLVQSAISRLPSDQRARFQEEWSGHLEEIPGCLAKLFSAIGFIFAARRIFAVRKTQLLKKFPPNITIITTNYDRFLELQALEYSNRIVAIDIAEIGIDGNCGFALHGLNLAEGEAEFVEIDSKAPMWSEAWRAAARNAALAAFEKLKDRLDKPDLCCFEGYSLQPPDSSEY